MAVIEDPPAPPYQEVEEPAPPRYPTPPRRREQIDAEVVLRYAFENQRPVFGVSFFVTGDLDEYLYVDNVTWVDDAWR